MENITEKKVEQLLSGYDNIVKTLNEQIDQKNSSIVVYPYILESNLTANEKLLFSLLINKAHIWGYARISNKEMATKLNFKVNQVTRILSTLKKKNWIKVIIEEKSRFVSIAYPFKDENKITTRRRIYIIK